MPKIIHPIAGFTATLTIVTFWLSTAISELLLSDAAIAAVKTAIPWGLLLLVPALAAVGGSGFVLSQGRRQGRGGAKRKRMPLIAGAMNIALLGLSIRDGVKLGRSCRR